MASGYEEMTSDAVGILEKAIKSKPKDVKARTDLQKKANAALKELQKYVAEHVAIFTKNLDTTTRTLEEAIGVAENEAKLFDREIVRHLKHAIKLSKAIDRPKGWTDDFDKAAKTVAGWDPKAEGVKELEQGIKCLDTGKKCIKTNLAAIDKEEVECNGFVDKAILDLDSMKDPQLKEKISPYLCHYAEFFKALKRGELLVYWWDGLYGPIRERWNANGIPRLILLDDKHPFQTFAISRYATQSEIEQAIDALLKKAGRD